MIRLLCISLCLLTLTSFAHADSRPNFILFITDDISQDDLGCYGNPIVKTPNLDQIAKDGVRFNNAYLTCSSCSPSRCSLITSRYPHNTGACELHTILPKGHFLFPKALKDAGYYTVLSGKHHMGKNADPAFSIVSAGKGPGKEEDWVEQLRQRPKDKPFFCWFASGDAHRSWTENDDAPKYNADEITPPPFLVNGPLTRQDLADYYHEVSRTDTFAGRLMDELKRQSVADNTYFIYMSDNGRPFPRCKTRVYDSGVKSPLIVHCAGRIKPGVCESLVSANLDVGATILDLAQVEVSERMQGVSFAKMLTDATATTRDCVFSERNWHVNQANERMVRVGDLVYIRNFYPQLQAMCVESAPKFPAGEELWAYEADGKLTASQRDIFQIPRPSEELFNIKTDPHQLTNLAGREEFAGQQSKLRALLDQWITDTHDSISSDPTQDRQDAQGKRNEGWRHRIQPGVENGSLDVNAKGPIRIQ